MDCRFNIKCSFSIYGENFAMDASLNWNAPEGEIDTRIQQFFLDSYQHALEKHETYIFERQAKEDAAAKEKFERAELKRLTEKYGA